MPIAQVMGIPSYIDKNSHFGVLAPFFLSTLRKWGFKGRKCVNGTESEKPLVKQCKAGAAASVLKVIYKYINAPT